MLIYIVIFAVLNYARIQQNGPCYYMDLTKCRIKVLLECSKMILLLAIIMQKVKLNRLFVRWVLENYGCLWVHVHCCDNLKVPTACIL